MECLNGAIHITGSYNGGGDGMGGFGLNLQTTFPDAGPGCQMIKGDGFTGITVDVTNTKSPNNHLYVGLGLANGNQGEYTATLASGVQTIKLPWSLFKNKGNCGGVPGPGIQNLNFGFDWFNDGADHPVDVILSNIGFY